MIFNYLGDSPIKFKVELLLHSTKFRSVLRELSNISQRRPPRRGVEPVQRDRSAGRARAPQNVEPPAVVVVDEEVDLAVLHFLAPQQAQPLVLPQVAPPPVPQVVVMPQYNNYARAQAMEIYEWYNVNELQMTIRQISRINFSVHAQRTAGLDMLNSLTDHVGLFALDKQFPEQGRYVCVGMGDWLRKMATLRSCLEYKEAEPKAATDATRREYNDTSLSFRNILMDMLREIGQGYGVFARATFEATFGLTWAP